MEASSDIALPITELSPTSKPSSIVWMSSALSAEDFAEPLAEEAPLDPAAAEDAAFRAVESRASRSCCAELRLPFPRSVPSWLSSLTNEPELLDDEAMALSRLAVMPLALVVAVDAVAPFCASSESVT